MKLQMMTHGQNDLTQGRTSPYYIPNLHQERASDVNCPVDLRQSRLSTDFERNQPFYQQCSMPSVAHDTATHQDSASMSSVLSDELMLVEEHLRPLIKQELRYSIQSKRIARGLPTTFESENVMSENEVPSPDTVLKRARRRERNKVAAAKCRFKKKMVSEKLQEESEHLEHINLTLKREIEKLQEERQKLMYILNLHRPTCIVRSPSIGNHTNATYGQDEIGDNKNKAQLQPTCSLLSASDDSLGQVQETVEHSQHRPTWGSQTEQEQYMDNLLRSPVVCLKQ